MAELLAALFLCLMRVSEPFKSLSPLPHTLSVAVCLDIVPLL